jgi:hypothetical protein
MFSEMMKGVMSIEMKQQFWNIPVYSLKSVHQFRVAPRRPFAYILE